MPDLVVVPFLALLVGCALELVLVRASNRTKGWVACLASGAAFLGVLALTPAVSDGTALQATLGEWDSGISVVLRVDGLSQMFMLMATGIGTAILLYSVGYMEHEPRGTARFYILMLVFITGLIGLVASANLLIAYIGWELIGLCSYFLVGFWYTNQAAVDGARKVLLITHIAGYGLLLAIVLIYANSGTLVWNDPAMSGAFTTGVAALMLVAAMAKSVIFPLHTWIPEAMNAPTPVSALLHSACYVKAGVYLIARMYSIGPWNTALGPLLLVAACATMLMGVFFALAQVDLKRLLAFSTVSQLGYIVAGLALGTPLGIAAALQYTVSHALFKGTLFLCAGAVQHATGTRDMRQLGGLSQLMPTTTRVWLIAAASICGVPLTTGFVAKWLLFDAALDARQVVVALVAWLVSVFTAFYFLKATVSVFYGELPAELRENHVTEAPPSMRAAMGLLAGLCVVFGVAPQLILTPIVAPAVTALGFAWPLQVTWFGFGTASGGIGVTAGALVAVVGVLFALAVYRTTEPAASSQVPVFTGGDPLPANDQLGAGDFAEMAEQALGPVYAVTPDPLYLAVWRRMLEVAGALQRGVQRNPLAAPVACVVAVAALVWFA